MVTKTSLIALLAACSINSSPDIKQPPEPPKEGQHFCCTALDKATGKGCVEIGQEHITTCNKVLYCGGSWMKEDGKVTCL